LLSLFRLTLDIEGGKRVLIHKTDCGAILQDLEVMEGVDWEVSNNKQLLIHG
jgi:hypothetical protein